LERIPLGSANAIFGVNAAGTSAEYLALSAVTADEKAALAGQSGTAVSASNKFVDNAMVAEAKTASKIPIRDSNSDILVATTPTAGDAAASKTYTDTTATNAYKWAVGDVLFASLDTSRAISLTDYTKSKAITVRKNGTIRVKFTLNWNTSSTTAYGRIYVNGSAVGTERSVTSGATEFSQDITIVAGDDVQIYTKVSNFGAGSSCTLTNFRIYTAQNETYLATTDVAPT
jgi:hypothetical protein